MPWVVGAVLAVLAVAVLLAFIRRKATTYTITSQRLDPPGAAVPGAT